MAILVVEDEKRVRNFLQEALKREGYVVHSADSCESALEGVDAYGPELDVVILDRLLYRTDAVTLIAVIKKRCPSGAILVLSTLNSPNEKAAALDLGADDYLGKPFSFMELSARIRSLIRRKSQKKNSTEPRSILHVKDLVVNFIEHKVSIGDKSLDLSHREYQVLWTLAEHPGRVFNKYQLLDLIWNTQFEVESNVVESTIKNVRKKLEQGGSRLEILSRRNVGYWIEE